MIFAAFLHIFSLLDHSNSERDRLSGSTPASKNRKACFHYVALDRVR